MLKITQIKLVRVEVKEDKVIGKFNITWEDNQSQTFTFTFTDNLLINAYKWGNLIKDKVNVQIKLVADEQNPKYLYVDTSEFIKDNNLVEREVKEERQGLVSLLVG